MEQIYTIPINEAFDALTAEGAPCECPMCRLEGRLEANEHSRRTHFRTNTWNDDNEVLRRIGMRKTCTMRTIRPRRIGTNDSTNQRRHCYGQH